MPSIFTFDCSSQFAYVVITPTYGIGTYTYSSSATASATGNTLTEGFTSLFKALIQPLLTNLDPNLNPGEMKPVTSVIKAKLMITLTFPDKDGDALITLPIEFSQDTTTYHQTSVETSGTTVVGKTSSKALTPTSASFAATLGLLHFDLNRLIPELDAQVGGVYYGYDKDNQIT